MPSEKYYSQSLQAQGFDISVWREAMSSISKVFTESQFNLLFIQRNKQEEESDTHRKSEAD